MNCSSCSHTNPAAARFCNGCGAALTPRCSSCNSENPAGARFCNGCGVTLGIAATATASVTGPSAPTLPTQSRDARSYTPKHLADKILQSRSALEGERKQVTVLFADVKGSMELAEQLDPEEWHSILERFFTILTEGVHRFEGTVNQYTGDGIMALFGAPIAHEDHSQRACYAALQLRDTVREYANTVRLRHGVPFGLRIGLNSGEVVVGRIGDDLRMDYTAQGHTVGLAQRMEALAESGHICVSDSTARLVEGYFNLQDLGRTRVKGVSEEISVHDLVGVGAMTTRLERSRSRGLSRFVGRDTEMAALDEALAKARSGSGQVIGVVAEAGTGKSRLCAEFLDSCRVKGIPVLEGRGVAHGKAIPLLPMLQLWRALFEIAESDGPDAVRAKIAGRLLLMDEAFRESLPLLFDLFGVPDAAKPSPALDPEVRQRRLHGVIKRFMNDPAFGAGVRVYLLEDLHWFDGASDAFLETIIESVPATHHLWIVNFRPEYRAGWLQRSYYHHLSLQPLTTAAIRALLRDHLGNHSSTAMLPELIHDKTRGNPFFIEEVVQSLVENGHLEGTRGDYRLTTPVTALQVPPTVQALLAARIDRLAEREKQVLQTASIIGKTFPEALLRRVLERVAGLGEAELGASLSKLVTAEFLFESALYPVLEYSFKHPLTQEVAQGSQLRERRNRVHAAVAEVLEAGGGNLDERAAEIAQHWAEAGEAAHAARWYGRAAAWAGQSNIRQALEHWRRVREFAPAIVSPTERDGLASFACDQILGLGWRLGGTEEEMASVFAEGRALAERAGDRRALALLIGRYGLIRLSLAGSAADYVRYGEEAAGIASSFDDRGLRAAICMFPTFAHMCSGNTVPTLAWAERVLNDVGSDNRLGMEPMGYSPRAAALYCRAFAFISQGRLEEAERESTACAISAEGVGDPESLVWAGISRVLLGAIRGDTGADMDLARRSLVAAEAKDSDQIRISALAVMGLGYLQNAMFAESRNAGRASAVIANRSRAGAEVFAFNLTFLADAHRALGEFADAVSTAREGVQRSEAGRLRFFEALAQLALAAALTGREGPLTRAEVESALARAEHLVDVTAGHSLTPQILEARARLAAKLGDAGHSNRLLHEALVVYSDIGATGHAARLAKELDA